MTNHTSIAIIGGGIIGCAIAYELSSYGYQNIMLIERNSTIPGLNQSSRNGGIIHSGVFYPKDTEPLKAKLCVEGNELMHAFAKKYNRPHKKMGKLIVAADVADEEYINFFFKVGLENGVPGIRMISGKEAKEMEPNIGQVTSAIHLPSVGSVALDPFVAKLKELAENQGVRFLVGSNVIGIKASGNNFRLTVISQGSQKTYNTEILINAAGLYSDEIAKMVNPELTYEIEPTRSELYQFNKSKRKNISMNGLHIYQRPYCYYVETRERAYVSAQELHTLLKKGVIAKAAGVHLSPAFDYEGGKHMLRNTIAIGPVKTLGLGKEDYTSHLKPPSAYIQEVRRFFPHLTAEDLEPRYTGIMAILKGEDDFVIERDKRYPNCIHLVGMDSPAWTSSLAVAKYVRNLMTKS